MARSIVRQLVVVGVLVVGVCALANEPVPAQFALVERYAALISEGDELAVRELLAPSIVLAEHDLFWSVAEGHKLSVVMSDQVRAMFTAGVRLEVELEAVASDGAVLITRERMWGERVPEGLAPLRSTGVYVVVGGQIVGITRVLDGDQRDGLMHAVLIGRWTGSGGNLRFVADGTYRHSDSSARLDSAPDDSGSYAIVGGVLTMVSDEKTQTCRPGDVGSWSLSFTSPDAVWLVLNNEMCWALPPGHTIVFRRLAE